MEKKRFSIFWPILFIALGVFLFMNNIGAISGSTWDVLLKLWPLLLIVAGIDGIWRGEGMVGSTVVIGLGVVFLMGNLGYLEFGSWEMILRLWPIFLVALGLDLIIGRRKPFSALIGVLVGILAVAGIVWLVVSSPLAVQLHSETVNFPLEGSTAARGMVSQPVGRLSVGGGAQATVLVEGKVSVAGPNEVRKEYTRSTPSATFNLSLAGVSSFMPFGGSANREAWELALNEKVSYDLELKTAVGEQLIDLKGLNVTNLQMEMAVGKQTLILPASGAFKIEVRNAVGEVIIFVPRGRLVQLRVDNAVTALDAPADFTRVGGMWYAPGSQSGAASEVSVQNAVGRISVQYLP